MPLQAAKTNQPFEPNKHLFQMAGLFLVCNRPDSSVFKVVFTWFYKGVS